MTSLSTLFRFVPLPSPPEVEGTTNSMSFRLLVSKFFFLGGFSSVVELAETTMFRLKLKLFLSILARIAGKLWRGKSELL